MAEVDPQKLEQFMGKMVTDMSAAMSGPLVIMGVKLGLYKALSQGGAMSSEQLAERSGVRERYVREWLAAQVRQASSTMTRARGSSLCLPSSKWRSRTRILPYIWQARLS